ncbi:hypothetical protein BDK92_4284 [Micromonospora pisi]|uniref:Uncharacterized protein n=1 Tax=Micromonospora pisi TaxID=589240 RepID=A0A495JNH1_9ACTN|nr:hypothetical protein BDK92_4284 [Micromonospora pisi]
MCNDVDLWMRLSTASASQVAIRFDAEIDNVLPLGAASSNPLG